MQQGVLSEARPLYLQLAEMQLKAGRQPQAAGLLRKLLEAEPENLRVQTRLAELLLSMAQQKEASKRSSRPCSGFWNKAITPRPFAWRTAFCSWSPRTRRHFN